jgi:short-subunit dehydrogenase
MDVARKVVVITGASRGIGADVARGFAEAGARLALCARSVDQLEEVAARVRGIGAEAIVVPTDVEDTASLQAMVDRVTAELGPVDVLVNNAGVDKVWEFPSFPGDHIAWIVKVNLLALITATRLVIPAMVARGQGHIVNMASAAGLAPVPYSTVYSATKHGVVGFSRALRIEMAEHGVGVSVVCPGFVLGEGMFAQHDLTPPKSAGSVELSDVTEGVLSAVRKNKAEMVVAPFTNRLADVVVAISPGVFAQGVRRTGVLDFYRSWARQNARTRGRHQLNFPSFTSSRSGPAKRPNSPRTRNPVTRPARPTVRKATAIAAYRTAAARKAEDAAPSSCSGWTMAARPSTPAPNPATTSNGSAGAGAAGVHRAGTKAKACRATATSPTMAAPTKPGSRCVRSAARLAAVSTRTAPAATITTPAPTPRACAAETRLSPVRASRSHPRARPFTVTTSTTYVAAMATSPSPSKGETIWSLRAKAVARSAAAGMSTTVGSGASTGRRASRSPTPNATASITWIPPKATPAARAGSRRTEAVSARATASTVTPRTTPPRVGNEMPRRDRIRPVPRTREWAPIPRTTALATSSSSAKTTGTDCTPGLRPQ